MKLHDYQTAMVEWQRKGGPPGPPHISTIHKWLVLTLGRAASYRCSCGDPARDWAYQHSAGAAELRTESGRPYSSNTKDYRPMCIPCHRRTDVESYRENGRAFGKVGGQKVADRVKADPEYAKRMTQNLGAHLERMKSDPDYSGRYRGYMRRTNLRRYRCTDCGHENNAGNMGKHKTKTGHENREEVI